MWLLFLKLAYDHRTNIGVCILVLIVCTMKQISVSPLLSTCILPEFIVFVDTFELINVSACDADKLIHRLRALVDLSYLALLS